MSLWKMFHSGFPNVLGRQKGSVPRPGLWEVCIPPHMCTSREPLFDLSCCLVTINIQGQLPNFSGSARAKEDLEFPWVSIGLRSPHQASGGTCSEVNRS